MGAAAAGGRVPACPLRTTGCRPGPARVASCHAAHSLCGWLLGRGKPSFTRKLPLYTAHQPISADSMHVRGLVTDIWRERTFPPSAEQAEEGSVGNRKHRVCP